MSAQLRRGGGRFLFEASIPEHASRRFERRIAEILREARRLVNAANDGAGFKRIDVRRTRVKAHTRHAHVRYIVSSNTR